MQKWITEEFAPEQAKSINQNISDYLETQKIDNKYSSIDEALNLLASSVNNEKVAQQILETQQKDQYAGIPVVEGMPTNYRPLWAALDDDKKNSVIRESRMYDMTRPGAVEKFWSTRKLTAETIVESKQDDVKPANSLHAGIFAQMKKLQG